MSGSFRCDPSPGDGLVLIPLERTLLEGETLPIVDSEAIEVLSGCLSVMLCPPDQPPELLFHLRAGRVLATPGFFGKKVPFPARCELRPEGQTTCLVYSRDVMQVALVASKWPLTEAPPAPESLRRRRDAVGARTILDAASLAAWQQKALTASFELIRALFERASPPRSDQHSEHGETLRLLADAQAELSQLQGELRHGVDEAGHRHEPSDARIAALEAELAELRAALHTQERMTNVAVASALSAERQRQAEHYAELLTQKDLQIADLELDRVDAEQRLAQQAKALKQASEELFRARTDIVTLQFSLETTKSELEAALKADRKRTPARKGRSVRSSPAKRSGKR